jgi:hypothetical protein
LDGVFLCASFLYFEVTGRVVVWDVNNFEFLLRQYPASEESLFGQDDGRSDFNGVFSHFGGNT